MKGHHQTFRSISPSLGCGSGRRRLRTCGFLSLCGLRFLLQKVHVVTVASWRSFGPYLLVAIGLWRWEGSLRIKILVLIDLSDITALTHYRHEEWIQNSCFVQLYPEIFLREKRIRDFYLVFLPLLHWAAHQNR